MGAYNIYAPTEATVIHQRVWSVLYNFGSGPYFIPWTSVGPVRKLYPLPAVIMFRHAVLYGYNFRNKESSN